MSEKVIIGKATLYLGDCLEVIKEIDQKLDQTISDPPYEENMHAQNRRVGKGGGRAVEAHKFAAMDEVTRDQITKYVVEQTEGWALFFCQPEGVHYWRESILRHNGTYHFAGIWVKTNPKPQLNGASPGLGYESIVGGWCGEGRSKWNGGGSAAVWTCNTEHRKDGNTHTSIKPQKLMTQLVGLFSDPGQTIFDPFAGSGSTGVAAVSMGRSFIGIERDPEYFEICCRRLKEAQESLFSNAPVYVRSKPKAASPLFDEPAPKAPKAPKPQKTPVAPKKTVAKATPRGKFGAGLQIDDDEADSEPARAKEPLPDVFAPLIKKYGGDLIDWGPWNTVPGSGGAVGFDVESFRNFFLINMTRFGNGEKISFEMSNRSTIDWDRVNRILRTECMIGFNSSRYDLPIIMLAMKGHDTYTLKEATNQIIKGNMRPWDIEKHFKITIPKINHVDLFDPVPSVMQSLKMLGGRLHTKWLQDLPYPEDATLTAEQMNVVCHYCFNDNDNTKAVFTALREPLTLRIALGKRYAMDLRSKSDAQIGEAIVKKRVEQLLGHRLKKDDYSGSYDAFNVTIPDFVKFKNPELTEVLELLRKTEFRVGSNGKVETPEWLEDKQITIGRSTYSLGKGGLHSTESHRAVHSDDEYVLVDLDVGSQYPKLILSLGLFPKALGKHFIPVYKALIDERLAAKALAKKYADAIKERGKLPELEDVRFKAQTEAEGGKIAANGVYGKLGSGYSILLAPHLMLSTTILGQLSIFMAIEMFEDAGYSVVSANTDGILARVPRGDIVFNKDEPLGGKFGALVKQWQNITSFEFEHTTYKSIYNSSVNTYIALKEDGKTKIKGPPGNPWADNDLRGMMSKNPQMTGITNAVVDFIKTGTPIEEGVRANKDVRDFVTVINVGGGGTWRGSYLGKVVRYYWSTDGDPIFAKSATKSGQRKVGKTDGCKPLMVMDGILPPDIDYERYIVEAKKLAVDIAAMGREGELL
jgi:hypothetical protein